MKEYIYKILIIPLLTISCNSSVTKTTEEIKGITSISGVAKESEKTEEIQIPEIPKEYIDKNLKEFGIKASIKVPKTVKIYKSILNDNEGERDFVVVHLIESSNKKLEIIPTNYSMKNLLRNFELSAGLYYKTTKLVKDSNTVFFESVFKGETKEFNKHVYDFLIRIELGGKAYFMTTDSHQEFTAEEYAYKKEDILKLYAIAKSIVENK